MSADRGSGESWRIAVTVPETAAAGFAWALERFGESVAVIGVDPPGRGAAEPRDWRNDLWLADRCVVEVLCENAPDPAAVTAALAVAAAEQRVAVPPLAIEPLPAHDWVAWTRRRFPEIDAGRYRIRGSHVTAPAPAGRIAITIDAATAFGTGEHETTRGCLLALDALARRRRVVRALDLGCGSGILAIAAARTWRCPVFATDIDGAAVREARRNARVNAVAALVTTRRADGLRDPAVRERAPWDLVLANILARPLVRLAPAIARSLSPGGTAVLSGLLAWQERQVTGAYIAAGLRLRRRLRLGDWTTLVLERPGQRARRTVALNSRRGPA